MLSASVPNHIYTHSLNQNMICSAAAASSLRASVSQPRVNAESGEIVFDVDGKPWQVNSVGEAVQSWELLAAILGHLPPDSGGCRVGFNIKDGRTWFFPKYVQNGRNSSQICCVGLIQSDCIATSGCNQEILAHVKECIVKSCSGGGLKKIDDLTPSDSTKRQVIFQLRPSLWKTDDLKVVQSSLSLLCQLFHSMLQLGWSLNITTGYSGFLRSSKFLCSDALFFSSGSPPRQQEAEVWAMQLYGADSILMVNCPREMVGAVRAGIRAAWPSPISKDKDEGGSGCCWLFQMDGQPWRDKSQNVQKAARRMICGVIDKIRTSGYHFIGNVHTSILEGTTATMFWTKSEGTTAKPSSVVCISPVKSNQLWVVPGNSLIASLVEEALSSKWKAGIASQMDIGNCVIFTLNGSPWSCDDTSGVSWQIRSVISQILENLGRVKWRLLMSIDLESPLPRKGSSTIFHTVDSMIFEEVGEIGECSSSSLPAVAMMPDSQQPCLIDVTTTSQQPQAGNIQRHISDDDFAMAMQEIELEKKVQSPSVFDELEDIFASPPTTQAANNYSNTTYHQ